jgi:hypothetical protein
MDFKKRMYLLSGNKDVEFDMNSGEISIDWCLFKRIVGDGEIN